VPHVVSDVDVHVPGMEALEHLMLLCDAKSLNQLSFIVVLH
jgi:hypothetical protein